MYGQLHLSLLIIFSIYHSIKFVNHSYLSTMILFIIQDESLLLDLVILIKIDHHRINNFE
jgi:hypothetical protein